MSDAISPHLVIVGGGHAHLHVLRAAAQWPAARARLTVISPTPHATYTGMVPGVIAGQYRLADAQVDVAALAARAAARFIPDRVIRIDAAAQRLFLAQHDAIAYDVLSLDIGAHPAQGPLSPDAPVVFVKPIEVAIGRLEQLLSTAPRGTTRRIAVVGAGAGGVELGFALRARLGGVDRATLTLCDQAARPLAERSASASRLVAAALTAHDIAFHGGAEVRRVAADGIELANGEHLPADLVVWATGAAAPALLATSSLPVDERGFLRVDASLCCLDYPNIFAAGDCITLAGHPRLPKAGVFAVREGPVLAVNLSHRLGGVARLQTYEPQRRFLSLINCADGTAILSYGWLGMRGRWVWKLKDWIDRRFVAQYRGAVEGATGP